MYTVWDRSAQNDPSHDAMRLKKLVLQSFANFCRSHCFCESTTVDSKSTLLVFVNTSRTMQPEHSWGKSFYGVKNSSCSAISCASLVGRAHIIYFDGCYMLPDLHFG